MKRIKDSLEKDLLRLIDEFNSVGDNVSEIKYKNNCFYINGVTINKENYKIVFTVKHNALECNVRLYGRFDIITLSYLSENIVEILNKYVRIKEYE